MKVPMKWLPKRFAMLNGGRLHGGEQPFYE